MVPPMSIDMFCFNDTIAIYLLRINAVVRSKENVLTVHYKMNDHPTYTPLPESPTVVIQTYEVSSTSVTYASTEAAVADLARYVKSHHDHMVLTYHSAFDKLRRESPLDSEKSNSSEAMYQ